MLSPIVITILATTAVSNAFKQPFTTTSIKPYKIIPKVKCNNDIPKTNMLELKSNFLKDFGPEICAAAPEPLEINQKETIKDLTRNVGVTLLSTAALAVILPPIKQFGLVGTVSLRHHYVRSALAIAPIVTFTVNAPPLLNKFLDSITDKSIPLPIKILFLALCKHAWIWAPECRLNALSSGVNSLAKTTIFAEGFKRACHTLREALLIYCVYQDSCSTTQDKLKGYGIIALGQTMLDRGAFPPTVPVQHTLVSRFLYIAVVKEVIDATTKLINAFLSIPFISKGLQGLDKQKNNLSVQSLTNLIQPNHNITNINYII